MSKYLGPRDSRIAAQCRVCPLHSFLIPKPRACRDRFDTVRGIAQHLSQVHLMRINWKYIKPPMVKP